MNGQTFVLQKEKVNRGKFVAQFYQLYRISNHSVWVDDVDFEGQKFIVAVVVAAVNGGGVIVAEFVANVPDNDCDGDLTKKC
jgi:hypothetical protein